MSVKPDLPVKHLVVYNAKKQKANIDGHTKGVENEDKMDFSSEFQPRRVR